MKKIITLLALMPIASFVYGQAITIASTDIPVPTAPINYINFTAAGVPNPTLSAGGTWNYSTYTGTPGTLAYATETDTFFTNAGINVNVPDFKSLTPTLGYNINDEMAFSTSSILISGIAVPAQGFGLVAYTGNTADSMVFPMQQSILTTPIPRMVFPFTTGSKWSAVSRNTTNFTLTVASASLNHTPGQQVYYLHRSDSISAWGTATVYTPSGPSIPINVLVGKVAQYSIDSFYLGGSPAPTSLLNAFGITQGQTTDTGYRYNFYRKGEYYPVLSFYYGGDNTYTTAEDEYEATDNLVPAGINTLNNQSFTAVLFPNPSNGSEINMLFSGPGVQAKDYYIMDVTGKAIMSGNIAMQQTTLHIDLHNQFPNGNYMIYITDNKNNRIVAEQFVINK